MTPPPDLQPEIELPDPGNVDGPSAVRGKAMTIGAVSKALKPEFPEISISKIRYLEDQKLLQPKRTQGGYRLYSQQDLGRLRTILRLQRDEFLPLRVIRQELARGRTEADLPTAAREGTSVRRVASMGVKQRGA
jgi:DNA-binding transcriptional MerR regulator